MRPSKLYLEIFISFCLAIIISETMIFWLFTDSERKIVGYKLSQNTVIKVQMLQKLVDEKVGTIQNADPWGSQSLRDIIASVEANYDATIWITNTEGIPLIPPGSGHIPQSINLLNGDDSLDPSTGIKMYNDMKKSGHIFTSIALASYAGSRPVLYIVFNTNMPPHHRYQFLLGLLIIGLVVSLLIIPVTKFITDRLKYLKISALRIAEGELSHRVTVKTRDEIGELGIAFNQMAERLERMIVGGKELTANISHELRTPLARIRIAQEMLGERLERRDFDKCEGRMDQIREDIEELDALIGSILELSKLDVHEVPLKFEPFSPAELLDELLEKLRPVIVHKNLTVQKKLPEIPQINGDRTALASALSNILDNAAKFSPEAGAILINMAANNSFFNICITNTYESLPERDLEKIFEPFYRSKKSSASGTGLGLSIAAKIIQKHGGGIKASNTREGFEICVGLPLERRSKPRGPKSKI